MKCENNFRTKSIIIELNSFKGQPVRDDDLTIPKVLYFRITFFGFHNP